MVSATPLLDMRTGSAVQLTDLPHGAVCPQRFTKTAFPVSVSLTFGTSLLQLIPQLGHLSFMCSMQPLHLLLLQMELAT